MSDFFDNVEEEYREYKKDFTIKDFDSDPKVIKAHENVVNHFEKNKESWWNFGAWGGNDDISEFMRDRTIRISTLLSDDLQLENAPEDVKRDYNFLKSEWERAKVKGGSEWKKALKDYGTDILASPEGLLTAISFVPTGGTSSAAVSGLGATARAWNTVKKGKDVVATPVKKITARFAASPKTTGAIYGGGLEGLTEELEQNVEITTNARTEKDYTDVALAASLGAGLGVGGAIVLPAIGKGISSAWNKLFADKSDLDKSRLLEDMTQDQDDFYGELSTVVASGDDVLLESTNTNVATLKGIEDLLDIKDITENQIKDSAAFQKFIREIGGGQATQDQVASDLLAAAQQEVGQVKRNDIKRALLKPVTTFSSKGFMGKATAFLTPYEDVSPTAKVLAERITKEYQIGIKPGQKRVVEDLSEAQHNIYGGLKMRFLSIVNDISVTKTSGLKNMYEVTRKIDDEVNDDLMAAMRGVYSAGKTHSKTVNLTAIRLKQLYSNIGDLLKDANPNFQKLNDYVPREWNRTAIEKNKKGLADLLIADGQAKNQVKAYQLIDEMLDTQNQLAGGGVGGGGFFLNKRKFNQLEYDAKYQEFLNKDVQQSFLRYIQSASNILAKKRILGVKDSKEFETKWINGIRDDLAKEGIQLSRTERERMLDLYNGITGEGLNPSGKARDAYGLANRLAYLGLATVTSFTEIFLNMGQAGLTTSLKGFKDASNLSFKRVTGNQHKQLQDRFGLTAEEAWEEMQRFGIAMEQSAVSVADRLAGETLRNETMQNVSNKFFRYNLLDQWTKFVQTTSFITGKRMIMDNIDLLAKFEGKTLSTKARVARDKLADLGINVDEALQWKKRGASVKTDWYVRNILNGASRYARNIILDVGRESGLKPRAFTSGLGGDTQNPLIGQLMGYPTAFSNTILKGAAKQLIRDKSVAAYKLIPTAMIMTYTAGYLNYVRDRGEGWNEKDPFEIGVDAAARWGGLSHAYDTGKRTANAAEYSNNYWSIPAAFLGPVAGDIVTLGRGPTTVVGTKVPLYGLGNTLVGKDNMKEYRKLLYSIDREAGLSLKELASSKDILGELGK